MIIPGVFKDDLDKLNKQLLARGSACEDAITAIKQGAMISGLILASGRSSWIERKLASAACQNGPVSSPPRIDSNQAVAE